MTASPPGDLYPLSLEPTLKPKVWGGTALERLFGYRRPTPERIGEVWLADGDSVVLDASATARTVADLITDHPAAILGDAYDSTEPPRFPLLAKFLDAESELSVQVHPPDEYARRHEGVPFGKAVAWYIIEARPGAHIFHGTTREIGAQELVRALVAGRVGDVLAEIPVQAGDVIINPPGTIHALGGGVVLYEIQQDSDITYRLYDWDRPSDGPGRRELHVRQAMDVANLHPPAQHTIRPVALQEREYTRTLLCACRYFCLELLELDPAASLIESMPSFHLLTQLRGQSVLSSVDQGTALGLSAGQTGLVPAAVKQYRLDAVGSGCAVLRSYVPDLRRDVVRPLLARGIAPDTIVQLGGEPATSDVRAAVEGERT
jgi:mannose-6-phosphate isomerase